MRLLIISNIPTPYRCAFFSRLNSHLEKSGHELLVIFSTKIETNRDWNPDKFEYNFRYYILPGFSLTFFKINFHFNYAYLKIIQLYNPTHTIMAGSWNMPIVMFLMIFKKSLLSKIFFWSESHQYSVNNRSYFVESLRKLFYNKFTNFLVPNELSSDFVKAYVSKISNIYFLPNTIDQNIFNIKSNNNFSENLHIDFLLNSGKINVIQVSQLERRKGVIELIEMFLKLPQNIQNKFNLILVGTGSLKEALLILVKGNINITIIDYLEQNTLANLYNRSHFFVLSSFKDPNPLSPIEALFSGKIILASKYLGNIRELIPEIFRNKLVFDPNKNFDEIFFIMIELFENKQLYNKIQSELFLNADFQWNIDNICNKLIFNLINSAEKSE